MLKKFSKVLGFFYVFVFWIKKRNKRISNKKNLIIITGNLGDALLSIEAVVALKDYYKNKNEAVYIATSKTLWTFLNDIEDMRDFRFLDISFPYATTGTQFSLVKEVVKKAKSFQFENIVLTWANSPIGKYLVAVIPHNNSWAVLDDINRKPIIPKFFFERAITNKIYVPIDTQEMQRYALMLKRIGIVNYKVHIHRILPISCKTLSAPKGKYITIAMDSNATERRWPSKNFKLLVTKLLKRYDYDICCTGTEIAQPVFEKCIADLNANDRKRIHNYISNTTLVEWIELLRGAEFHIGVDSGSIHVAASVGTKAFCLAGVWDGHRVFPYEVDEDIYGTCIPVPVYRTDVNPLELSCYGCLSIRGHRGLGNKECRANCELGKPTLCLRKIKVNDVLNAIEIT